ncbi:MAG TPA: LuxR C-terminal-related transcriptional regulator [Parachlamydiaceae bacterium]|nr:LuxR C-terminal-related transcriptional regulator [Parachlamydiaceae bacterium]
MLNWNEIYRNYIVRHSKLIKTTTQPLRDHFGIKYFFYYRIYDDGKITILLDRPDWMEHYVNKQIFLHDPYMRHPSVYKPGICLVENHGSDEFKETVVKEDKKILNMDTRVILIQKKEKYAEFFGFYGDSGTSSLQSIYLNRPKILQSFASHFKKELSPILNHMEHENYSLIDLKGPDFFCKQSICPDLPSATLVAFYKDLGIKCEFEKAEKLSIRERQCLKLLTEEKTAKEIAAHLGLSSRTVEYYFENIKDKLSCFCKQEVLACARTFEDTGLL